MTLGRHEVVGVGATVAELRLGGVPTVRNVARPGPSRDVRLLPGRIDVGPDALRVLAAPDLDAALILVEPERQSRGIHLVLTVPGEARRASPDAFEWSDEGPGGRSGALRITPPPGQVLASTREEGTRLDLTWDPACWLWSDAWCKLTRTQYGVNRHGSHAGSINICYLDGHAKFQGSRARLVWK